MSDKIVAENSSLLMHITMKLSDGSAADSTKVNNKPARVNLGDSSISPAFEQQLLGLQAGDSKEFTLAAIDAFGEVNPENIHYVDRQKFTAETLPEVGAIMTFTAPGGEIPGVIREVNDLAVTVDFNHPLAGQEITFAVDVVEVL
ncbi:MULTISPECIES: FKBP-type peptidyl-prolyl cis-trans isomerase [unclassified Thalassotalea]|uniref:FKBP-type peptidyl-prolyl cis-trans isomerase n=1 Tax=unclassified Thalassotalea TaxID=2614972 RepID=UPI001081C247|nr:MULTISPECIES: FKBP-type peptidyl-prolyl cis-trans isomerase [unclassified Thalassotalea]NMP14855.1 FKBP-type peptidyl-prolyl cis-trans isomerase [Thalassotalea sp. Y01]QBY03416.1 FKBP-type peptidyl-prolyl cis-trans isomerase [Thalassotalea sp. HSM 43]